MAKSSRGGKRGGGGGGGGVPMADQPMLSASTPFNQFMGMSDDQKADAITAAVSQDVPAHLSNTDYQKFVYNMQLNDRPQLVDDATLASMNGKTLYRTVNSVYDSKNDIGYNADQIAKQIQSGRITRTSDNGGSVYGRGLYFADNRSDSTLYGNTRGNVKRTAVVAAKLNSNANVIQYNTAFMGMQREINSGSKLGRALSRVDTKSAVSIYAVSKGYNVISNGASYLNVLNRNAITMSKSVNPM